MDEKWIESLERLAGAGNSLDAALAGSETLPARALALAQALRFLWPIAPLYACQLSGADTATMALNGTGAPQPQWAEWLQGPLAVRGDAASVPVPPTLQFLGPTLAVESLDFRGQRHGALAIIVSDTEPSAARALLSACASLAAPRLYLMSREAEDRGLRQEHRELASQADLGEMVGPVAHESNNFLNVVLLQLAVLEPDVPPAVKEQLDQIRRQAKAFKTLVQQLQGQRQRRQPKARPVALNAALQEAVAELGGDSVRLDLAPELPLVWSTAPELKRLAGFLLAAGSGAAATVRTEAAGGKILLRLQPEGGGTGNWKTDSLEWAVCQGLVRRLQGKINLAEDGQAVIELPTQPR